MNHFQSFHINNFSRVCPVVGIREKYPPAVKLIIDLINPFPSGCLFAMIALHSDDLPPASMEPVLRVQRSGLVFGNAARFGARREWFRERH
jgi:hypothetical protein